MSSSGDFTLLYIRTFTENVEGNLCKNHAKIPIISMNLYDLIANIHNDNQSIS